MSKKVFDLIAKEEKRQRQGLEMIPSENYVSENVLKALGSILTDKYSEGFPGKRYYGGNEFIDQIEIYCQKLANKLFSTKYAIVQPYSGSPANLAVDLALANPGDAILGMELSAGGHLTHGAPVSFSGKLFQAVQYGVGPSGRIDMDQVRSLALEYKPKVIWAGTTAYPYKIDFEPFAKIARRVGAYLVADISHIAGLVVTGAHPSPADYVDIITTTTHKTLRGPRGAIILITERGFKKDPELSLKIEKAIFPGLQGGPHNHQTAAIAVALEEASTAKFKVYIENVVRNARILAKELGSFSENHLVLLDLQDYGFGMGYQAQVVLEAAGITVNKNAIPNEPSSPFYPSGIRLGTPALTSRGMKEKEMVKIAHWIKEALEEIRGFDLPKEKETRARFIEGFKKETGKNLRIKKIAGEVKSFAEKYPVPGIDKIRKSPKV